MSKTWHGDSRDKPQRKLRSVVAGTQQSTVHLVKLQHMYHGYNRTMVSATVQYSVNVHSRVQSNLSEELHYYCQLLLCKQRLQYSTQAVSYTHLTLPTIYSV